MTVDRTLPRTEQEITAVAKAIGMPVPGACMPGLIATFAVLDGHLAQLRKAGGGTGQ